MNKMSINNILFVLQIIIQLAYESNYITEIQRKNYTIIVLLLMLQFYYIPRLLS